MLKAIAYVAIIILLANTSSQDSGTAPSNITDTGNLSSTLNATTAPNNTDPLESNDYESNVADTKDDGAGDDENTNNTSQPLTNDTNDKLDEGTGNDNQTSNTTGNLTDAVIPPGEPENASSNVTVDNPKFEQTTDFLLDPANCNDNCKSCWGVDSAIECWECVEGALWEDGKCKKMNSRDIAGYGRPCIECGTVNFHDSNFHCYPCPYSCKECDFTGCITCKTDLGFTLSEDKECLCFDSEFYNGRCMCGNETYLNENGDCVPCAFNSRMKKGCDKCPDGYYDVKENGIDSCAPCHYSCATCDGGKESDCLTCNVNDLFELYVEDGINTCLCVCYAAEVDKKCLCNAGYTGSSETHQCIANT